MTQSEAIELLKSEGFTVSDLHSVQFKCSYIITHYRVPSISLGYVFEDHLRLKEDVLPPGSMRMIHLPFEVQDDSIRFNVQHLHKMIENSETRIRLGRLNNVKKYFKERRDMVKMLEKTRYDLSRGYQV